MRWCALLLSHLVAAVAVCSKYKLFAKISFFDKSRRGLQKSRFLTNHDEDDDGKKQNLDPLSVGTRVKMPIDAQWFEKKNPNQLQKINYLAS